MRVLICGGRDFVDRRKVYDELTEVHKATPISVVIHGAARGADSLANDWARGIGLPVESYPADWQHNGRAAGPLRNVKMLHEGKPDLVVVFRGGRGTEHMTKIAREAGVTILYTYPQ